MNHFGQQLTAVVLAGVIVMELVGPIATQWGLRFAGESAPLPDALAATRPPAGRPAEPTKT